MKKLTALILAITLIIVSGFAAFAINDTSNTANTSLAGDVDMDNRLTIKDATLVRKFLADLVVLTGDSLIIADVNKDGCVNVLDATVIQKEIANIKPEITNPSVTDATEETTQTVPATCEAETESTCTQTDGEEDIPPVIIEVTRASSTEAETYTTEYTADVTVSSLPDIAEGEGGATEMELQVWRILNAERIKAGVKPLKFNYTLLEAARIRATEAATTFSHTRPDGTSFSTVFAQFNIRTDNICYGENLARYFATPEMAMRGLMNSEGHRANILHVYNDYVAIGIAEIPGKPGLYALAQLFTSDPWF